MSVARGLVRRPVLLRDDVGDLVGKAAGVLLRRQFVEGAVVGPADHVGALHLADDLVAAFFSLKMLLERLELRHALAPTPSSS